MAAALGLGAHSPQILAAGFSFAGMRCSSLFAVGLLLVAVGIILNLISLTLKSRQPPDRAVTTYTSTPAAPTPNPSVVSPDHRP
jgi:hypothetical protein